MKLEKLSSLKFEDFKAHSIENVNAIVGGIMETTASKDRHDTVDSYSNGQVDGLKMTANGSMSKDK
jgi:hypothetical protein